MREDHSLMFLSNKISVSGSLSGLTGTVYKVEFLSGWWLFLLLKTTAIKVNPMKLNSEQVIEHFAQKIPSKRKIKQ